MLQILKIKKSTERTAWLDSFQPETKTWLVSDLRSKFEIQNILIQRNGFYEDHAVLRANELWQTLLKRFAPDFRIVGRDFLKAWLREKLSSCDVPAAKNRGEETVLSFLDSMMQIISHPDGLDYIHEWLVENKNAQARWGVWFDLSYKLGQELLASKRISAKWIAPWLSNQSGWESLWNKDLIVDLGPELSRPEAQVLQELSRHVEVTILQPELEGEEKFNFLMRPYEEIHGFGKTLKISQEKISTQNSQVLVEPQLYRFTSPLAEVKHATHSIRHWIESGVSPENIVVSATNIEEYWPMLQYYFFEEGIPVAKDLMARQHSLPAVMRWLSRMKLAQRNFEYPDLEMVVFSSENVEFRHEKFKAIFKNLLDETDLGRDSQIFQAFKEDSIPQEPISIQRVFGIISRFWQDENLSLLEGVMRTLLEVSEPSLLLKFSNWIFWIEQICTHAEFQLIPGNRMGVQLVNIQSVDSPHFTHRIFLGMTESAFKNKNQKLISSAEVEKILSDTGFQLPHPEQLALDFEMRWLLQNGASADQLYFPMTNNEGSVEAPHKEWMERSTSREISTTIPTAVRGDANLKPEGEMLTQIRQDLGEIELAPILNAKVSRMSASQLETFFDCGFKFAANKLFKLQDPSEVDLDPDLRSKGQLIHAFFESLTEEPRRYDWTHDELKALLNSRRDNLLIGKMGQSPASFGDQTLWPSLRENLAKLSRRFLDFEKSTAPERKKTMARELQFKTQVDGLEWVGSVDRIDLTKDNELVVYDYKSRNDQYNASQWLKKNHLQLGFYSWLISKGLVNIENEGLSPEISKALYYVYKDFKMHGADKEELSAFNTEIEEKLKIFKSKSESGEFQPQPHDVKTCEYCQWSQLCRAPHLNH